MCRIGNKTCPLIFFFESNLLMLALDLATDGDGICHTVADERAKDLFFLWKYLLLFETDHDIAVDLSMMSNGNNHEAFHVWTDFSGVRLGTNVGDVIRGTPLHHHLVDAFGARRLGLIWHIRRLFDQFEFIGIVGSEPNKAKTGLKHAIGQLGESA